MPKLLKSLAAVACVAALAGCAHDGVRPEPHHFSKDARGNRIACYTTAVANEYECVPTRSYAAAPYPYPYYDPFWATGFYYGWPGYHDHVIYVVPTPSPTPPPPAPAPPPHWKRKR